MKLAVAGVLLFGAVVLLMIVTPGAAEFGGARWWSSAQPLGRCYNVAQCSITIAAACQQVLTQWLAGGSCPQPPQQVLIFIGSGDTAAQADQDLENNVNATQAEGWPCSPTGYRVNEEILPGVYRAYQYYICTSSFVSSPRPT